MNGEFLDAKIRHKLDQVKPKVEQKNQNALKIIFKRKSIFDLESSIIGSLIYVSLRKIINASQNFKLTMMILNSPYPQNHQQIQHFTVHLMIIKLQKKIHLVNQMVWNIVIKLSVQQYLLKHLLLTLTFSNRKYHK